MGAGRLLQVSVTNPEPLTKLQSQACLGSTPLISSEALSSLSGDCSARHRACRVVPRIKSLKTYCSSNV